MRRSLGWSRQEVKVTLTGRVTVEWREMEWAGSMFSRVSRICQLIVGHSDRERDIKVEAQVVIPFTERGDSRSSCLWKDKFAFDS